MITASDRSTIGFILAKEPTCIETQLALVARYIGKQLPPIH